MSLNDGDRFDLAVRQITEKRLTYNALTAKEAVEMGAWGELGESALATKEE